MLTISFANQTVNDSSMNFHKVGTGNVNKKCQLDKRKNQFIKPSRN